MLRRFVPLLVCLALAILVLLSRLWDVQVVQHEVWAREAANIVRSYGFDPYVRGTIRDRNGDLIVRDEERYSLEFVWRDFRRGHPLGQVAMMRSLTHARPFGLDETRLQFVEAALGYARVSPDDLKEFAKGGLLDVGVDYVPAIAAETKRERRELVVSEHRRSRAADLRFYVLRLLDLKPRDVKELDELVEDKHRGHLSYLELAARVTRREVDEVEDNLRERVGQSDEQLIRLAGLIEWGDDDLVSSSHRLVELIEEQRRAVDNDTADALFRITAGFSPTRLNEANLARLDLEWLRTSLDWDTTRLNEWRRSRGTAYAREVAAWGAGFAVARSKPRRDDEARSGSRQRAEAVGSAADRVISACAHAFRAEGEALERMRRFGEPEDWRMIERLAVIDALEERLADGDLVPEDAQQDVFPYQDPELPMAAHAPEELLELVYGTALSRHALTMAEATDARALAEQLFHVANDRRRDWKGEDEALFGALLLDMHARLQVRVAEILAQVEDQSKTPSRDEDEAENHGLAFGKSWIERAEDRRRYVVRDRGARSKRIGEEPQIDLVLLVTRYRDAFAGFRVTSTTQRIPIALGPDGKQSIAAKLIGRVRSPFLVDVLRQQPRVEELIALQRKLELPEADRNRILALIDSIQQPGSTIGGSGLEAWFDQELAGEAGYREVHGLQDRIAGNRAPIYKGAVDGKDITLTLDISLQRAAEEVLSNPNVPGPNEPKVDDHWFASPIGAIVLTTIDGEILVAASVPLVPGPEADPQHPRHAAFLLTNGERRFASERTLRRPTFQPPGSVVKPLMAAYALQNLGLKPADRLVYCDPGRPRPGTKPKGGPMPGFGQINCNVSAGHTVLLGGRKMALRESLKRSCNTYFAALAERLYDGKAMRDAYHLFGFGTPTGVRYNDDGGRRNLIDDYRADTGSPLDDVTSDAWEDEVTRQFLGNGLRDIEASVMQVARAYAGLASGALPEMRLVKEIGGEEVPRVTHPLGLSRANLEIVHDALDAVVHENKGSANSKGLGEEDLGFRLAAKTGSADYDDGRLVPKNGKRGESIADFVKGMRKHTWLAGWFPSRDPKYVVVIYLHDTVTTSSHSAVFIAHQFLTRPEIKALVSPSTADVEAVEASAPGRDPAGVTSGATTGGRPR